LINQPQTVDGPAVRFGVERPRLIGEIVLDEIRNAIIEKRLAPGARLSEVSLADMLNVSKTPVREALLQLRVIGLVTAEGGNLRVVLPSPALVKEAYEVRAGLEALTARLAAERVEGEELRSLLTAATESNERAESEDMDGFRKFDRQFHVQVALASQNKMAAHQVMNSRDLCQALRQRDVITDQVSKVCGQAHLEIAASIASRNGDRAGRLMSEHVDYVRDRVLASMVTPAEGTPSR
jgi:DNA-binding GntR family transcriptional regulator